MSGYFAFRRRDITCKTCGWHGKGKDCDVYEMHEGGGITDYACPNCGEKVGSAPWPTAKEYRDNWADLSEAERKYTETLEKIQG